MPTFKELMDQYEEKERKITRKFGSSFLCLCLFNDFRPKLEAYVKIDEETTVKSYKIDEGVKGIGFRETIHHLLKIHCKTGHPVVEELIFMLPGISAVGEFYQRMDRRKVDEETFKYLSELEFDHKGQKVKHFPKKTEIGDMEKKVVKGTLDPKLIEEHLFSKIEVEEEEEPE